MESTGPAMDIGHGSFGAVPGFARDPSGVTDTTTTTSSILTEGQSDDGKFDDDDDDIDESLAERLWGLTEMFPDGFRNSVGTLTTYTVAGTKALFSLGKKATWIAASSASILILPVMFEAERAQLQEQQIQQQRQILLGPNAAVSGSAGGSGLLPGAMPGVMPVPIPQQR